MLNPECIAMCRVGTAGNAASYEYANGFETGTPTGATAGSDPIDRIAAGNYVLYLKEACDYGSTAKQGGLAFAAHSVETGANVPTVAFATVAHGDTTGEGAGYAGVDAMKKVHVRFYDGAVPALVEPTAFTVMVFRNPITLI